MRETQHRHGYQQSLSQSLSGISTICGNWGAFPKGQHPSALQHFQWLPLLTVPQSSWKARGRPYTPLMLGTLPWWHSSGMPPSDTLLERWSQHFHFARSPVYSQIPIWNLGNALKLLTWLEGENRSSLMWPMYQLKDPSLSFAFCVVFPT